MGHRSGTNQLGYESTSVPGEQFRRDVTQKFGCGRCRTSLTGRHGAAERLKILLLICVGADIKPERLDLLLRQHALP